MNQGSPASGHPSFLGRHGYAFDIFFSYAHGDVRGKGDAQLKRWSRQLYEALGDTLDSLSFKPPPRIFFDDSDRAEDGLDRTAHVRPELLDKVKSAALFQLVMSPQYLESRWCRDELAAFVGALPDGGRSVTERIFIAKALDTDGSPWPPPFDEDEDSKPVSWYFHKRGSRLPYGWMTNWRDDIPDEMHAAFMDMVDTIQRRLRALDAELTERSKKSEVVKWLELGQAERIYLYGRSDDEAEWEAVWKELDTLGIDILPGEPEPLDADDDTRKRNEYARLASRCDAMVMVGADGLKLDFDLDVVGRERRNFIASKYRKYLPCAVVDRKGDLARPARVSNARRFGIDWIDPNACDWPDYIKVWLQSSADKVRQRYGLDVATS
jgi:hypothetical protein